MKRFILPLLIIFIFISLPAKANDEVKTLLKVLDKSLQNKASYTQQKQRQIDRQDLADKEAAELAVIQSYLPKPLTEEELTALIDATIAEVGATSPREMGKVISAIMATHKGRVDGKALSAAVKARLTA